MFKGIRYILACGLLFNLVACTSTQSPTQRPPAFLPNYNLLKPVPSPEGTQIYTYKNPAVTSRQYQAVIVEPVSFYQTDSKSDVSVQAIEKARALLNANIKQIISKKTSLVTQPGVGVARVQVAITGASFQSEGFKPWNIIPISAAIKLASMATDTDSKKPVLVIEIKITDSQSGQLLKEVVTTISGKEFRGTVNASDTFAHLASTWVQEALKYTR